MNAQQLKNSILQEAIQGRLVPQDPTDEPASILLERIRAEKERLVKEGKLKKKDLVVNPISEDEIPFDIPDSWEWVRLISLNKYIHYGYTASAAQKGNSKLLRITDIQEDQVNWATVPFCTIKDNDLEKYQLHNRDILIARTGGTIGKTYIVRELNEVSVFASYLIRAIPLDNVYEEYLKLFMGSPCYWAQLTDAASGTGQPNVNGQSLSSLMVPLPPLAEQKRIVAKIEELLPKVEEYGKAQDALDKLNAELPDRLKKSVLQEAIEGRLVPQDPTDEPASVLLAKIRQEKEQLVKAGKLKKKDLAVNPISEDEIPFEIPDSWEWVRLVDIGIAETGTTPSKSHPEYFGTFIPFLGPANMLNGQIISETQGLSELGANYGRVVPEGSILQVCIGGSIGKCAIVDKPVTFNQQINSITPLVCVIEFIYYVLQSDYFRLAIKDKSTGTATPIINRGNWEQLAIPIPPLAEQKRIVAKIEEVFKEIDKLKK